jgi:hypothetical protein
MQHLGGDMTVAVGKQQPRQGDALPRGPKACTPKKNADIDVVGPVHDSLSKVNSSLT